MTVPVRVAIVGRDVALWLAAATLARALRPIGVTVAAVELPTRLGPRDVIATLPPLEALHARIGIDEARLLAATGGSFSLGQNFVMADDAPAFFHAWGSHGAPIDREPFLGHWLKARHFGLSAALQDFSLSAVAAKNGRMLFPDEETEAFGRADYGYHLPAMAYAGYLKAVAVSAGATLHRSQAIEAARSDDGDVVALRLDDGSAVEAELFVDASGAGAVLADAMEMESWASATPVDRVLHAAAVPLASVPPYAELRASANGWSLLTPTRAATGLTHAYSSAIQDDAAALRDAAATSGLDLREARVERLAIGFRDPWTRNCIAIGGAAATLDAIHSTDVHLVQLGLVQLLSAFPTTPATVAERAEYNRAMRSHAERIQDFQTAFYRTSRREGRFWDRARASTPSPELEHRLATFAARGTVAPMEDDTFLPDSWIALLIGQGLIPASWAPAIDTTDPARLKDELRRILGFIAEKVRAQPGHDAHLRSLAGAAAA